MGRSQHAQRRPRLIPSDPAKAERVKAAFVQVQTDFERFRSATGEEAIAAHAALRASYRAFRGPRKRRSRLALILERITRL